MSTIYEYIGGGFFVDVFNPSMTRPSFPHPSQPSTTMLLLYKKLLDLRGRRQAHVYLYSTKLPSLQNTVLSIVRCRRFSMSLTLLRI
jgi:hypothetical protein